MIIAISIVTYFLFTLGMICCFMELKARRKRKIHQGACIEINHMALGMRIMILDVIFYTIILFGFFEKFIGMTLPDVMKLTLLSSFLLLFIGYFYLIRFSLTICDGKIIKRGLFRTYIYEARNITKIKCSAGVTYTFYVDDKKIFSLSESGNFNRGIIDEIKEQSGCILEGVDE